jgi:hypothetical protein
VPPCDVPNCIAPGPGVHLFGCHIQEPALSAYDLFLTRVVHQNIVMLTSSTISFGCREFEHAKSATLVDIVLKALLVNQRLHKFSRGTLTIESNHSVFNSNNAGKGKKSFDYAQVTFCCTK